MLPRLVSFGRVGALAPVRQMPVGSQARYLGLTTKGPPMNDIGANYLVAKTWFTKPATSYFQYKAQCEALRIFTFMGVSLGCVTMLFLDPPKSSYWTRWNPLYLPMRAFGAFKASEPATKKYETETDVATIYADLTLKRRISKPPED